MVLNSCVSLSTSACSSRFSCITSRSDFRSSARDKNHVPMVLIPFCMGTNTYPATVFKGPPDKFSVKLTNMTMIQSPVSIRRVYLVGMECFVGLRFIYDYTFIYKFWFSC